MSQTIISRRKPREQTPTSAPKRPWLLSAALWLLLLPMQLAAWVLLAATPWARQLAWGSLPVAAGSGILLGIALVLLTNMRRWRRAALAPAALLALATLVGAAFVASGTAVGAVPTLGTLLLGSYAATLLAVLPWLVLRARQAWLAVGLVWLTAAGVGVAPRAADLPPIEGGILWLIWLLALSALLLGLSRLREEQLLWRELRLQRIGPVGRQSLRTILLLSLALSLLGIIPTDAVQWQTLSRLYQQSPLSRGGPVPLASQHGTPVSAPGATLALDAIPVQDDHILLSYEILGGTLNEAPLMAATLDTFDGATWTQRPGGSIVAVTGRLPLPPDADLLKARITIENSVGPAAAMPILGFSQPIGFSAPVQARLLGGDTATTNSVSGWQAVGSLSSGASYTTVSAIVPADARPVGSLPASVQATMTELPSALQPLLLSTAKAAVGDASTPVDQAQALLATLKRTAQLDSSAVPPAGSDGVSWFLMNKRGNALLWTTTYIALCRSLGIPMRLAEGYLPGTFDIARGRYVVRGNDAAVWAQMAIPGEGWVDIFPAASTTIAKTLHALKQRLPLPTPAAQANTRVRPSQGLGSHVPSGSSILSILSILALSAALLLLTTLLLLGMRWLRLGRGLVPIARIFSRIAVLARLAGIQLFHSDTASVGAARVAAYLPDRQAKSLMQLNSVYEQVSYGPPTRREQLARTSNGGEATYWRRISGALWRLVLLRPWRRTPSDLPRRARHEEHDKQPSTPRKV